MYTGVLTRARSKNSRAVFDAGAGDHAFAELARQFRHNISGHPLLPGNGLPACGEENWQLEGWTNLHDRS
jgi:hypothetical protein